MSARHTPGPFRFSYDREWNAGSIHGPNGIIADVHRSAHCEGNGNLFAAAPELLEALEYVLPLVVGMEDRIDRAATETPWGTVAERAIRKAIAKARGQA